MGAEKQRKTFLSYSRVNESFAIRLAKELKSEGFNVWLDQLDIPAGMRWDREIERALKESEIFMIILTSASVESENVLDEIGYAIDMRKRILPVLLEKCDIPLRLRRFQYVDFTNKGFDDGVESAKELLRNLIEQPTLPKIILSDEAQQQMTKADRKAMEDAQRLAAQRAEEERLAKAKIEGKRVAAQKAEEERLAKEEADRFAAQRAEAEKLAKQKADEEQLAAKAKAEADRKAKLEAERIAAQKAKEEAVAAEIRAAPVAAAPIQEKPASKARISGITAIAVFAIVGIAIVGIAITGVVFNALSKSGNKNAPISTPASQAAVIVPATKVPVTPTTVPTNTATPAPTPMGGGTGKIAFVSDRDGNGEIYIMDSDGSGVTNLTNNSAGDYFPVWSPDGKQIAFESSRDEPDPAKCDPCNYEIYIMNADGSGLTRLTNNSSGDYVPSWSPDGKHIAFHSKRDGNREIYSMNADGSGQTRLTNNTAEDYDPIWSPDGEQIAFYSDRDGNYEIYIMNADGSRVIRLTNNAAFDGDPVWSPDGKHIAFDSSRDEPDPAKCHPCNYEIYIMNADGSGVTRLTNNKAVDDFPVWSPDGKHIAFESNRDDPNPATCSDKCNYEIYIVNAYGSGVTRFTNNPSNDFEPAWQP